MIDIAPASRRVPPLGASFSSDGITRPRCPARYAAIGTRSTAGPVSGCGQVQCRSVADLELLDMAGLVVVRGLEMDVDVAVARREDAAMSGRVKADDRGLGLCQLELDLNFFVLLHVVRRI